jgi:hemerythrin
MEATERPIALYVRRKSSPGRGGMPIFWREEMRVGDDLIDNDHRYLICLINTVELSLVVKDDNKNILSAIDQLEDYTQRHFTREEVLQERIKYPQREAHRIRHRELMAELGQFKTKIPNLPVDSDHYQHTVDHLIQFLRRWLLDHVIKEDLLMKPHILTHKPPDKHGAL